MIICGTKGRKNKRYTLLHHEDLEQEREPQIIVTKHSSDIDFSEIKGL